MRVQSLGFTDLRIWGLGGINVSTILRILLTSMSLSAKIRNQHILVVSSVNVALK